MKLYPGDKVMDDKGRTLRLTVRMKIAGRKGWEARTLEKPERTAYVLDTEIKATKVPEGYQCFLA